MRPGQNRRMRGRSNNNNNNNSNNGNRKSPNPLQRSYESNGPDVKVRGTAQNVAEKYLQLARDAQSSGDPVAAENYFQHAEHYYRILLAAQEQMTQQFGHSFQPNRAFVEDADDGEEEGEEDVNFQGGQQQGERQHNGNGVNGHGGQRQDGEDGEGGQNNGQRFDRPNNNNRPERNFDRNGQRRFDRNDRQDRGDRPDRGDRQDRGERRFDRPEGQNGSYAPRPEAQPGAEQPDIAPVQPPIEQRRFERPERQDRPPRGERPSRRDRDETRASNTNEEQDVAAALPAFLTTPTRVPIAIAEEPEAPVVASPAAAAPAEAVEGAPEAGEKPKRRAPRRRSPREVMDALGGDGGEPPAE
ncbi:hypothetical protein B5U98_02550 [Bosea sp. Tri-39]|nr:hypothetical protein BLM15_15800 [Bosea sp. Tri-49]RXT27693.1 hypothetical protein B5U98_02550 [Bosea sp. Tri-39]RXT35602.1 hypothetical protein B5U99_15450 [Bosea sp. Tri-54]